MDFVYFDEYSQTAREHADRPRNYGPLGECDGHARVTGPCGDTMEFWLAAHEGRVTEVTFITDGCGASRACGSMITCMAKGKELEHVVGLRQRDVLAALGRFPEQFEHCALLAVNTLKAVCEDFRERQRRADSSGT